MKKLVIVLMCLALIASTALTEENSIDVDFTRMDAQSAVNALYDMMDAPEENQGRTVKLRGTVYRADGLGDELTVYYLALDDPSSCCGGLQLEFVPAPTLEGIEDSAVTGAEIDVTGKLDFEEEGYPGVRLVDALIELPTV